MRLTTVLKLSETASFFSLPPHLRRHVPGRSGSEMVIHLSLFKPRTHNRSQCNLSIERLIALFYWIAKWLGALD